MGDVEDPELYAAQPLYEWQQTEQGQWVIENCSDPQYIIRADVNTFGQRVIVYGEVKDQLATEYLLRWSNVKA
jgi:hypothetical protein